MDKQQIEAIRKRMPSYDRPSKSELLTPYGTAMQDATALLKAYDALAAEHAALREQLARELDGIKALEAVIVSRGARLAEAEALLREARMGVKNSAVQFGYPYTEYVDRIDAFLTPDSASVQQVKYGCHCDIENMPEGYEPDACVMDDGLDDMCVHARQLRREGKDKTSCSYWKPIKAAAFQP